MFNNTRYMILGVQEEVSLGLQIILWQLIDDCKAKGIKMDYLQVFELSAGATEGQPVQVIQHRQEKPAYQKLHRYAAVDQPLDGATVWVIDDGDHSTMLLPSDY